MKISRNDNLSRSRQFSWRCTWIAGIFMVAAVGLSARDFYLQLVKYRYLQRKGESAVTRVVPMVARRGSLLDRNGDPLAISEPVDTLILDVVEMHKRGYEDSLPVLAEALHLDTNALINRVTASPRDRHLVLKARMDPDEAARVLALPFRGLSSERSYKRYYPAGEVTGQLLGMTDLADKGQEGLEYAFDSILSGQDGFKRVVMDGKGRVIAETDTGHAVRPGQDVRTSIDLRIQYLAYRDLVAAVNQRNAKSGVAIVVDARTGEVLAQAVATQSPVFNPNDREHAGHNYRNIAMLDTFEPGSTFKSFWVAAGLETGKLTPETTIDTGNGFFRVGSKTLTDEHKIGKASLAMALAKSSNVALAHIGLMLDRESVYNILSNLGFGKVSESLYPAEPAGRLPHFSHWKDVDVVTMAHGYSVAVTPFQLVSAYTAIAAGGVKRPLTFRRLDGAPPAGVQVLSRVTAQNLTKMLESVITEGTAKKAAIRGYTIAGKTGTVQKIVAHNYSSHFRGLFVGMVPASDPRLVTLIVLDDPSPEGGLHQGGDVAAPVFSSIMTGALRLLSVRPDEESRIQTQMVRLEDPQ